MSYRSHYSRRRQSRKNATIASYVALIVFGVSVLAFIPLVEMAVYVAEGNKLHIGADILFASFSSAELAKMACTAGAAAVVAAIVGVVASLKAEDR